jgi:cytochrome c-type biogenesis protein CcmH
MTTAVVFSSILISPPRSRRTAEVAEGNNDTQRPLRSTSASSAVKSFALAILTVLRLGAVLAVAFALPAHAVEPDEMLKDPKLEARAEHIGEQLRCPVCKTESIEESDADFTQDLRRVVRERVAAGDTDSQVLDYMHARYGDFILLKPPFEPSTWALWLAPPLLLVLGGGVAFFVIRRRTALAEPPSLSDGEQAAIEALK